MPAMFAEMNRRTLAFRGGGLVSASSAVGGGGGGGPTANGNSDPGEAWVRQEAEQLNGQGVEEEVELETVELEVAALEAPDAAGKELLLLPTAPADSVAAAPAGPMFVERNRRTLAFRGGGSSSAAANNGCEVAGAAWPRRPLNGRGGGGSGGAEEEELELEGLLEGKELVQDGGSLSDSTEDEEDGEGGSLGDGSGAEGGSCSSSRRSGGDEAEVNGAGEGESIQPFPLAARPKSLLQKLHVSFQGSWLKEFPWLQYCQQTGLMFCAWCASTAAVSADGGNNNGSSGGHDELCKGTRNYKRPLLLRHHLSAEHQLNEPVSAEQASVCVEGEGLLGGEGEQSGSLLLCFPWGDPCQAACPPL